MPTPGYAKILLAIGLTIAGVGATLELMNPLAAFYVLLISNAIAHFGAYLGWGTNGSITSASAGS